MVSYLRPGVHLVEAASGGNRIEGAPTSVAALVGHGAAGPVAEPVRVHGWDDYKATLGGIQSAADTLGLAAYNFFLNGGRDAYIARLPDRGGDARPGVEDYNDLFTKLGQLRDVSIVLLPGQHMAAAGSGNPVLDAAIAHCEAMGDRMVIIDPPPGVKLSGADAVNGLGLPPSTHAVLYYPWVKVANPFYGSDAHSGTPATLAVAPSSFAAGIWARTDGARGVWQAPAGAEAALRGAAGLQYTVTDGEQDQLNPEGVNCLRALPGRGTLIWGARTLATRIDPQWRYVPVRRTALHLAGSIRSSIRWASFEPNDHRLWTSLRTGIGAFMDDLFRAGAFQGQKAADAYFVHCGLGTTMTQDDLNRGQVVAVVGFAPLKPAEFVVIRIRQRAGAPGAPANNTPDTP